MIEKWHERSNGPVFKIIFALVTVSFVLGGIGAGFVGGDTSAAKVNGNEISQHEFTAAKNRQQNVLNTQLGEQFWDLMDRPEYVAQFNQSVLNSLVNDEVLRQYAQELKLGISADQIKSYIVHDPNFQQDGKFNNDLYLNLLRNNGLSADGYAAMIREGMLNSQLQEGIVNSGFSVPAQQELLAKLLLQQRQVRLATFPIAKEIANQTATAEELQAYYEANKTRLLEPEKLTVEYVVLTPSDVAKKAQVTDEQIADYYAKNQAQYVTKGETRLAHIQLASEADAKAVAAELQAGGNFAEIAKAKSTDKLSAMQGGDLGWAKAGTFPKAFEDAANALQAGQVSAVVNVDGSFHLIKVLERKPEVVVELAKVKDQIAKTLSQELLVAEYSNVAREMANTAFENSGSLENVAKAGGVTLHKTAQFTQQNVPTELQNEKVLKVLFDGDLRQTGQNSEALDIGDEKNPRTIFVRVSDYQAERSKTFDEAKAEVETAVKREKAEKHLLAQAETAVKALSEGKVDSVKFAEPQTLTFGNAEQNPTLVDEVFAMPKPTDKATYDIARNAKGDVVIVALDKVIDGKPSDFAPMAAQFNRAENEAFRQNLLQDLRERASISINEEFMQQTAPSQQ